MRKVIAAINMTIDGYCDHTAGIADEQLHEHYSELLNNSGVVLYGRITYQLMQYWQTLLSDPSDDPSMNAFAHSIDRIPKIVFSNTLRSTNWASAHFATRSPNEEVLELKKQPGKDILIGSRSLIIELLNAKLIDEFQICIHPVVEGRGLPLFHQIKDRIVFKLAGSKSLTSGATILYYQPS